MALDNILQRKMNQIHVVALHVCHVEVFTAGHGSAQGVFKDRLKWTWSWFLIAWFSLFWMKVLMKYVLICEIMINDYDNMSPYSIYILGMKMVNNLLDQ